MKKSFVVFFLIAGAALVILTELLGGSRTIHSEALCDPDQNCPSSNQDTAEGANSVEQVPVAGDAAACATDAWKCSDWSASCDAYGRERRRCSLSFACRFTKTQPPGASQPCSKLQCGNKAKLRDRVLCRLNLAPAGLAREFELEYLPEACRVLAGDSRQECVSRYKLFQSCLKDFVASPRLDCARSVIVFELPTDQALKNCQDESDAVACKAKLKNKVMDLIGFIFDDLQNRAEDFRGHGLDVAKIADFETNIETQRQAFLKAKNKTSRRLVVQAVHQTWLKLIGIKALKSYSFDKDDRLTEVLNELSLVE